jgi:hypothetical protein
MVKNRPTKRKEFLEISMDEIFKLYESKNEVEFVSNFLKESEIKDIIGSCGLDIPEIINSILFEHQVLLGKSQMRADLLVKTNESTYYFEVMSKSGRWDDAHHSQLILKREKLLQKYPNLITFAIFFKELDSSYQEDFEYWENTYGVRLKFTPKEFDIEVVGNKEEKIKIISEKKVKKQNNSLKWIDLLKEKEIESTPNDNFKTFPQYIFINNNKCPKKILQILFGDDRDKVGIKLRGGAYSKECFKWMIETPDLVINELKTQIPELNFEYSDGITDKTFLFNFNREDHSSENIDSLIKVVNVFAKISKIENC